MRMIRRIQLTEGDLNRIVRRSVKQIIRESYAINEQSAAASELIHMMNEYLKEFNIPEDSNLLDNKHFINWLHKKRKEKKNKRKKTDESRYYGIRY